jgi:hypothetical protein
MDAEAFERLDAESKRMKQTRSELAKRLLEEGLRMEAHPGVVFRNGTVGRRPALADGPQIWVVASVFREMTCSRDEAILRTVQLTGISPHQVEVAMRYYAEYREEIDAWIQAQEDYAEQAYAEWLRDQAVLSR